MKIRPLIILSYSLVFFFLITSCKSEFEKIRVSGDPNLILTKGHEYYESEDYLRAQILYELILNQFRGTKEAEKLFFNYSYTHYHLNQFTSSTHYFKNFANTFAYSDLREESDFMSAYSNYRLSPVFRLDQKPTMDAIEGFQDFVNKYPESDRVTECNGLIDEMRGKLEEKAYDQGVLYHDLGQYQAAITSLENMLDEFPESDRAEEVRYLILKSAYLYAANSVFERREERFNVVLDKYVDFKNKYGTSNYRKEISDIYNDSKKQIKLISNDRYQDKSAGSRP